jgi:hypothetical protein
MRLLIVTFAILAIRFSADADVLAINFDQSTLNVTVGDSVEFTGELTNPGTTDIFLNGGGISLDQSLFADPSPFFTFAPAFLSNGETYTGPFFTVFTIPSITVPGSYSGTFEVDGGTDSNAFDSLATAGFTVQVLPAETATSEPRFFWVLCVALATLSKKALVQGAKAVNTARETPSTLPTSFS